MRRVAAIDIGTNTILMVVAERVSETSFRVLRDEHAIARLGKGVDAQKRILPETFERVLWYLQKYKGIAEELQVDAIIACGTSALREASNQKEFIDYMNHHLGITIQVLSGQEEAQLSFLGTLVGWFDEYTGSVAVLDIGGGSTELAYGLGFQLLSSKSVDIGSVRITERYLKHSPPLPDEIATATEYIRTQIEQLPKIPASTQLIGVAGTITTLAALIQNLTTFQVEKIHRFPIQRDQINAAYEMLKNLSHPEILAIPSIHPQRADIIFAGILLLRTFVEMYNIERITVSTQGLRYGLAFRALFSEKYLQGKKF